MMTMKKIARALTLTFSLSLAVSLVACGGEEPAPPIFDEGSPAAGTEPAAGQPSEPAGPNTEPMSCEESCEWDNGHGCNPMTIDCTAVCQKLHKVVAASGCGGAYDALTVCLGKHADQLTCTSQGICTNEVKAYAVCVTGYCQQNPTACQN